VRINTNMKYYSPVTFDNLEIIQEKVLDILTTNEVSLDRTSFSYLPDNLNIFLNIPELRYELDKLNWTPYAYAIAVYVVHQADKSSLHIDKAPSQYSLNIPILNCKNTFTNFYKKPTTEPTKISYRVFGNPVKYDTYNENDCILQDKLELNSPHVINIKEVHNVVNNNPSPRITLLIRLAENLNLDHVFQ